MIIIEAKQYSYTLNEYSYSQRWYFNKLLHRNKNPAIIDMNGHEFWYQNGKFHRDFLPAVVYANENKHWFVRGVFQKSVVGDSFDIAGNLLPLRLFREP